MTLTNLSPIAFADKDAARAVDECVGPRSDAHRRSWESSIRSSLNRLGADMTLEVPPRKDWKPEPAGIACRFTIVWTGASSGLPVRMESFSMSDPGLAARYLSAYADGHEAARRHFA